MPKGKKGLAMNSANAIPEGIDTFDNKTEANFADKEVSDTSSEKPLKKARGRPQKVANTEVHSNGEADLNGVEEISKNDTYDVSDKCSSIPSSEDDMNLNQELEKEDMGSDPSIEEKPQKKKGGRSRKERKVDNKADDPETNGDENKVEEDETEAMPKKKGGRYAKKTGRGRKPAPSKEEANENENLEEEKTEVLPKKRGRKNTKKTGRGRKPASSKEDEANENQPDESEEQLASVPEEKESDEDDSAKPQKAAPKRGKGRKPAAAAETKPKAEKNVAPEKEKTKGRKRKTPTETVDEAIYKKLNADDLEEAKNVKVSLLRQQDIDDMALNLLKSDEGKVQAAAGTSGKGRGRKRAAESEDSASTSKRGKATASKAAPKREKIPDVNALDFDNKSTDAKGKSWNLKIATWNVNGLRAWLEKDGMTYLTHEDPDILCIQETKCSEDKIPSESNPVGYHCYWVAGDKEGYSGVGLMSKQKPLSVEYGIRKKVHDGEGRVITAEYKEYYLVATYVPNAGRKLVRLDYRKQWDIDFRAYLKKLDKTKPVILCGDLNVAHNEIDLANPKTNKKNAGFTQEERDGFSSLLSEGYIDAFRHLYPDTTGAYTFWTYLSSARAKNVGWRLDYFVLSERITENICDCVIRKDVMGSDHCPLVLFLRI